MHTKKPLSIGIVALLVLSMAMVTVTADPWDNVVDDPHAAQAIWVDPNSYLTSLELDTLSESNTFTVDVLINVTSPTSAAGTGLWGFEYKLKWDDSQINVVSIQYHVPPTWTSPFEVANTTLDLDTDGTTDGHLLSLTTLAGTPFTGVTSLCTYVFHVEKSVYEPSPDEIGTLDLYDDKLVDDDAVSFAHTTDDGDFRICAIPIPSPKLSIQPAKVQGVCGEPFNVTIEIYDVVPQHDLWGWEAKVKFNTTHLDALNSYEGWFLPANQGPNGTYYINIINNTVGVILTAGGFLGNHTAPNSAGTWSELAILEFNASFQTIAPDIQASEIELYDTKLVGRYPNGTLYDIEHEVVQNATYNVPYKVVGWFLDSYTWNYRKMGNTTFTGKGINVTADSFEPQELVVLYAYLEYNFEPEAYKDVEFEIHGPANPVYNITIWRTARTNASGIATINFTIPGSGLPNWEEMVFGKWTEYEAAQVKWPSEPPYYAKPEDWLWFEVGWIVELLNVTVSYPDGQDGVKKSQLIDIVIWYKNIAMMPMWVLVTVTVYDELWDPIQWDAWWIYVDPAGYGHNPIPFYNYTIVWSHIPDWTHVGLATVYVNAFTNFPMLSGVPYCPEITTTFWVLATADP